MISHSQQSPEPTPPVDQDSPKDSSRDESAEQSVPREIGGREGLDPTRYGDWEKNGRCIDF